MSNYKEIVTKTIVGKGRKTFKKEYNLTPENTPNTVLGCWVINHNFSGSNDKNEVLVQGSFDVNVWYSYDHDSKTAVTTRNFTYTESMRLRIKDVEALNNNNEIIVRSLKQPTVQDVKIKNNEVYLTIEKELGVEIVGEGKVKIAIEEDELPWDDIYEEEPDIDEEYLKDNTEER
ncbi:MAG TPA: outer spore coat protein CotE [Candidatus Coprovivens excrementavium]|nr:outer spore coat protein CotE [Candidatus Coprovivens excrementavium]